MPACRNCSQGFIGDKENFRPYQQIIPRKQRARTEQRNSNDERGIGLPFDQDRPIDAFLPCGKHGAEIGLEKMSHQWQARKMNKCGVFVIVSRIVTGKAPRCILQDFGAGQVLPGKKVSIVVLQYRMERWIHDYPASVDQNFRDDVICDVMFWPSSRSNRRASIPPAEAKLTKALVAVPHTSSNSL